MTRGHYESISDRPTPETDQFRSDIVGMRVEKQRDKAVTWAQRFERQRDEAIENLAIERERADDAELKWKQATEALALAHKRNSRRRKLAKRRMDFIYDDLKESKKEIRRMVNVLFEMLDCHSLSDEAHNVIRSLIEKVTGFKP